MRFCIQGVVQAQPIYVSIVVLLHAIFPTLTPIKHSKVLVKSLALRQDGGIPRACIQHITKFRGWLRTKPVGATVDGQCNSYVDA